MRFVDSHLHLEGGASELLRGAKATGTLLVACGVDRGTSELCLREAEANPGAILPFVGVHPSEAEKVGGTGWVRDLLGSSAGVGEVGLDPKYPGHGAQGAQLRVFRAQLEAAEAEGKPVQVHSRGAETECLDVMSEFRLGGVLMHWLQSEEALPRVQGGGSFVSFGPALLYSKKLQKMARRCDPRQVLTETDSPVPYAPLGGIRGPSLVPSVVLKLAEIWGLAFEEARQRVLDNSLSFLGLPEKG